MEEKVLSVLVRFDGTKYCFTEIDEEGKVLNEACCDEAKEVITKAECTANGYSDRPGFLMRCSGKASCEGGALVIRGT